MYKYAQKSNILAKYHPVVGTNPQPFLLKFNLSLTKKCILSYVNVKVNKCLKVSVGKESRIFVWSNIWNNTKLHNVRG